MRVSFFLLVFCTVCNHLAAQPVIDGTISAADGYTQIASYTSGRDGFGPTNDMGAIYYTYRTASAPGGIGTMYIGITGRIDQLNNIVLFLDFNSYAGRSTGTLGGGTTSTLGVFTTNGTASCGGSGGLNGAVMDDNFDADYAFAFNEGNTTTNLYCDAMRFSALGSPPDGYFEQGNIGSCNQTGTATSSALPFAASTGQMRYAYRNDYNPPGNSTSGIEFSIPYTALPGIAPMDYVRFFAAITDPNGYFSNETMPGDAGPLNLGCDQNFSLIPGQTFYTGFYILPFSYTNFKGTFYNGKVNLNWQVTGNEGTNEYLLERSTDGYVFKTIKRIPAFKDQTNAVYSSSDEEPIPGLNYYRIVAVDYFGNRKLSETIHVRVQQKANIVAYPNPITANTVNLFVQALPKGSYQLQLFNTDGKMILNQPWLYDGVSSMKQVDFNTQLPGGVYLLRVMNTVQSVVELKIMK